MEVRVYSREMEFLGVIDNFESLIWTRKYNSCGTFELYAPATEENLRILEPGNMVVRHKGKSEEETEAGIISTIEDEESRQEESLVRKGNFLPVYLKRRIIQKTVNYSGEVAGAIYQLLNTVRKIPMLEPGPFLEGTQKVEFQVSYKNLLSYIEKLAKLGNIGFKITANLKKKRMTFSLYEGKETTVLFSEKYENIEGIHHYFNDENYITYALVGGEGEGEERTFVEIDLGFSGLDRREVFIDARDVSSRDLRVEQDKLEKEVEEKKAELEAAEEKEAESKDAWETAENSAREAEKNLEAEEESLKQMTWTISTYERSARYYLFEKMKYLRQKKPDEALEMAQKEAQFLQDAEELREHCKEKKAEIEEKRSGAETARLEAEAKKTEYTAAVNSLETVRNSYTALLKTLEAGEKEIQLKYKNLLLARGIEKMAEMIIAESVECNVNTKGNYTYKKDYDLGDLVMIESKKYALKMKKRLTEITEIWEYGAEKVEVTLGDALPEKINLGE